MAKIILSVIHGLLIKFLTVYFGRYCKFACLIYVFLVLVKESREGGWVRRVTAHEGLIVVF